MTREAFEAALDAGRLEVHMGRKWYRVRRNGRTRTWKGDLSRFVIPIKFRFRDTDRITENDFNNGTVDRIFRIVLMPGVEVADLGDPNHMMAVLKRSLGE